MIAWNLRGCCVAMLAVACSLAGANGVTPKPLLPHEAQLMQLAAAPGGVRVLVTLNTDVDTAVNGPLTEQERRTVVAQAHAAFKSAASGLNVRFLRTYDAFPIELINVDQVALAAILSLADVRGVQGDHVNMPLDNGNDAVMNVPAAWASGFFGADEVVAVLDSGVEEAHPFLSVNGTSSSRAVAALGGCFSGAGGAISGVTSLCPGGVYSETGDPNGNRDGANCDPSIGGCEHGTHVAGIAVGTGAFVGGNNENGVAVQAALMPIQVYSCTDTGTGCAIGAYDSDIISALGWVHDRAVNSTYRIAAANLSLGMSGSHYTTPCDDAATAYKAAIDTLRNVDSIATVMSSGNDGFTDGVDYPACISSAVTAAATDNSDNVMSYSDTAAFVSFYAPGDVVYSSIPTNTYGYLSGTSMSAPQVAGALAIVQAKFNHGLSVTQAVTLLQKTGKPITANGYSLPRIDVGAAVDDIFLDGFDG